MRDLIAAIIIAASVMIILYVDDDFKQRWCATYPDWCMPVSDDYTLRNGGS